jgi:hypothetical protein
MRGPKLIKYHSCDGCEHLVHITRMVCLCNLLNDDKGNIWNAMTPEDCPYLIKIHRKNKLNRINNNEINL